VVATGVSCMDRILNPCATDALVPLHSVTVEANLYDTYTVTIDSSLFM